MKRRLEALARIGKLQKQLHELAAWRLAQIGRRRDGLAEDERAMWRAMGEGVTAYGPPAEAGMRRIRQFEAVLAHGFLGAQAQKSYAALGDADRGQIRELYLRQVERVAPEVRQKFFRLYASY